MLRGLGFVSSRAQTCEERAAPAHLRRAAPANLAKTFHGLLIGLSVKARDSPRIVFEFAVTLCQMYKCNHMAGS